MKKSKQQIAHIEHAGHVIASAFEELPIVPGLTTAGLNKWVEEFIRKHKGCTPAFKGYKDYPAAICTSVNEEVVHGLPSVKKVLEEGDIVSVDIGVVYKGFHADACRTFPVGRVSVKARDIMVRCRSALRAGIGMARAGNQTSDITAMIELCVGDEYGIPLELAGHGIGRALHEDPQIYNCYREGMASVELEPGMVICIEPVITAGRCEIALQVDGWTVQTLDESLCAHEEHTVLVTKGAPRVLTTLEDY